MLALKSGLRFLVSASEVPFFNGHFCQKCLFQVPKNGTSDAETKKWRPLFNANIPPKRWFTCLFCAYVTFGWIEGFEKSHIFDHLLAVFPLIMAQKLKLKKTN